MSTTPATACEEYHGALLSGIDPHSTNSVPKPIKMSLSATKDAPLDLLSVNIPVSEASGNGFPSPVVSCSITPYQWHHDDIPKPPLRLSLQEMSIRVQPKLIPASGRVTYENNSETEHNEKQLLEKEKSWNKHIDKTFDLNDAETNAELGKLRFQVEVNRDQKASMSRSLAQKDLEIQKQRLDLDDLKSQVSVMQRDLDDARTAKSEADRAQAILRHEKSCLQEQVCDLEAQISDLKIYNSSSVYARLNPESQGELLDEQERTIMDLKQSQIKSELRVDDLEEEVQRLELSAKQDMLAEKKIQNDLVRQLQQAEQQVKVCQARLQAATKGREMLSGAVHLVRPNAITKLPRTVMACHECYANNFECDEGARCRNCTDRDEKCARWRCSITHKLGECNQFPCAFPHDDGGWLMLKAPRPEW